MNSRKIALSLAKQYRTCPPEKIRRDPGQQELLRQHEERCPYCAQGYYHEWGLWDDLQRQLQQNEIAKEKSLEEIQPGQLYLLDPKLSGWDQERKLWFNSPIVLVLESDLSIADGVLVAQTYHDITLAGPGDLILEDIIPLGGMFIQAWHTYTLKKSMLSSPVARISSEFLTAVRMLAQSAEDYPEWALKPRPMSEADPRIYFRELEIQVGYFFASRAAAEIIYNLESYALCLTYSSEIEIVEEIDLLAPGTYWTTQPQTVEQALTLAHLTPDRIPLAAETEPKKTILVNLVLVEEGKLQALHGATAELFSRHSTTESLFISGRIENAPSDVADSRLICHILDVNKQPISPLRLKWDPKRGSFYAEFPFQGDDNPSIHLALIWERRK